MSPVWVAGGSVFLISDENRLVRLDAATGETIWAEELPFFTRERLTRRKSVFSHFGPVLAGGRLLVASDDGQLREFDPVTGSMLLIVGLKQLLTLNAGCQVSHLTAAHQHHLCELRIPLICSPIAKLPKDGSEDDTKNVQVLVLH